jgi:uroporphyrinogen decarboxylase
MNSLERIEATLQGQATDRVPVLAVLGAYGARQTGTPVELLYQDPDSWLQGQTALRQRFGLDMLLAPFDFSAIAAAWGAQTAWFVDQAPNVKRPASIDPRVIVDQAAPGLSGRQEVIVDAARKVVRRWQEEVPVFAVIPGPCSLPALVMGMESWLDTLLFDWPLAQDLLTKFSEYWCWWARQLADTGIMGLVVPEGMAAAEITTPALFREKLLPSIRACFEHAPCPLVLHHTGGSIGQILADVAPLPNLAGVAVGATDCLVAARKALGPAMLLLGNVDNVAFQTAKPGHIYATSTHCLQTAAGYGPYALCNAGGDIPMAADPHCIDTMLQAAIDYGPPIGRK